MEGFNPARGVNGHNEFFKVLCGYIPCGGPIPRARSPIIYLKDSWLVSYQFWLEKIVATKGVAPLGLVPTFTENAAASVCLKSEGTNKPSICLRPRPPTPDVSQSFWKPKDQILAELMQVPILKLFKILIFLLWIQKETFGSILSRYLKMCLNYFNVRDCPRFYVLQFSVSSS